MPDQPQALDAGQAQELAQEFHDLAVAIGQFRLDNVATLTPEQQSQLLNLQLQCVQFSNHFIAMGLFAAQADLAATLAVIKQQTTVAANAIETINDINKALQIATAAAVLGASIASLNPSAVATGVQGLVSAVQG